MDRKDFLKKAGWGAGALAMSPLFLSCRINNGLTNGTFQLPLKIPDEIRTPSFDLDINTAGVNISDELSLSGYLFNDQLPGPTFRLNKGDRFSVEFRNNIDAESIIHWHGLIVPPDMDGHPKNAIQPGEIYQYDYTIDQRAATYWYHPHPHGITANQVYRGLAGFYIVEDEEEKVLNLPSGDFEIPLVIQDRRADNAGNVVYDPTMHERMMSGFFGDLIFINGVPSPFHEVKPSVYRLRVLNGSNARIYNLALNNGASFTVIGSDGGLLPEPITTDELLLSPSERVDLLIDFSVHSSGDNVQLISKAFDVPGRMGMMDMRNGMRDGMMRDMMEDGMMGNMMRGDMPTQGAEMPLMEFRVQGEPDETPYQPPEVLSEITFPDPAQATKERRIELGMEMMTGHTINGKTFEMTRVDEQVRQGDTEIWEFVNNTGHSHPMHIHAVYFKVLERSGGRGLTPTESGWKDTVLVMPDEQVKVIVKFDAPKGIYVFHCHNLEHEDGGMMANLEIT